MRGQPFAPYRRITRPRWDAERGTARHVVDSLAFLSEARSSYRLRSGVNQAVNVVACDAGRMSYSMRPARGRGRSFSRPRTSRTPTRRRRRVALDERGPEATRSCDGSRSRRRSLPQLELSVLVVQPEVSAGEPPLHRATQSRPPTPTVGVAAALSVARVVEPLQKRLRHDWSLPPGGPEARGWTATPTTAE